MYQGIVGVTMESFTPITLPAELANTRGVQGFQTFLRLGGLAEWQIGYERYEHDRHICSRFVTAGGTEDSLTSPDPKDTKKLRRSSKHTCSEQSSSCKRSCERAYRVGGGVSVKVRGGGVNGKYWRKTLRLLLLSLFLVAFFSL